MGLFGILLALAVLMWLAYRGWSILLVAPLAALVAAAISREPLLAHWTQTFMGGAARFFIQWFPMFLLGGLFGKLMDDSGSISSIARFLTERLGTRNTMLAVVLASALVTYGGVSVFVAFFVLVPMAQTMFKSADLPRRLLPATIGLGAFTFTMSALPGSPSVNNAIPMPYFGTTTFAAPGIGIIASVITLAFGMWWLRRAEAAARKAGEGYGGDVDTAPVIDEKTREHATAAGEFDPAEVHHGKHASSEPSFVLAVLPLFVVIVVNFLMSLIVFPRLDFAFLANRSVGGNHDWRGGGSVVAAPGAWGRDPGHRHRQLQSFALFARKPGCRRQLCGFADPDDLQPCRFRRRRCSSAGVFYGTRRGVIDSGRATDLAHRLHERSRRADWHGFRRHGDCTQCTRRHFSAPRR